MVPKQGNKWALCIQKGKKKYFRGNHDSSLENLEKLILTPLVTVSDFSGFWLYWACREASSVGRIQSYGVLHCRAVTELWVIAPLSVIWLTSHHTP